MAEKYLEKRRQIERNDRLINILKAARKIFINKGYFRTTLRDIAKEAQLSTGAIYFYFKGKDEIYGKICEEAFYIMIELLRKASTVNGNSLDRIEAVCRAYLKFYTDFTEYFDLITFKDLGFRAVGLSSEQLSKLEQLSQEAISILHDCIVEGKNSELIFYKNIDSFELTFLIWSGIEGIIFLDKRGYLNMYGQNKDDILNLMFKNFFQGIQTSPPYHPTQ